MYKVFKKLFPVWEIRDRDNDELYLSRWFILGRREDSKGNKNRWGALMLHKMWRPDSDACHHDHPWWFITLVLRGGYVEQITNDDGTITTRLNRPGMVLYRKAEHTHRIHELPKDTCWTLVLRGRKIRDWGFVTREGWEYYLDYLDNRLARGIAWCSDRIT